MKRQLVINLSVVIPKPTGISVYAANIIPWLKPLEPLLLTADDIAGYECQKVPNNMTPEHGTKGHLRRLIWTQFKLPLIYRKSGYKLLFSPLPEAPLYTGCRSIVMAHDLIPLKFPKRGSRLTAYFKSYVPAVLKQAQHIVCNSEATGNSLVEMLGISARKITPILLGYDRQRFQFLDLPTQNYFLYIGRHDHYKNLPRLITAFSQLPKDYELWLAGPSDSTYTPLLKQQVKELGLREQVKFLDYVAAEELPSIINRAIALVFPSLWEGFGFPVLEAMACGTPVITSNLASLPEVAGEAAILINPYEVEEISAAMKTLISDPQISGQLRHKGLSRCQEFSWQKTGQQTVEVLARYM
ncbi:glycosyltransferase family 1 protein [Limnospira sp. PMC 289.06]|uniref:glycosyltransferase family 4 protein n=1 Tax=Limnospira sp. PMC 289.06 TaxID=2981094 RepID=UPI0028E0D6C8|nr:glycosyltransferase family 1 protein [Limnospira sp. PMC 289.06]